MHKFLLKNRVFNIFYILYNLPVTFIGDLSLDIRILALQQKQK